MNQMEKPCPLKTGAISTELESLPSAKSRDLLPPQPTPLVMLASVSTAQCPVSTDPLGVILSSASTAFCPMSATRHRVIPTRVEESLVRRHGGPMRQRPMDALLTKEGSPAAAILAGTQRPFRYAPPRRDPSLRSG